MIPMISNEFKWVQVSSNEFKWDQVRPGDTNWDEVTPWESKWEQVRLSESSGVAVWSRADLKNQANTLYRWSETKIPPFHDELHFLQQMDMTPLGADKQKRWASNKYGFL